MARLTRSGIGLMRDDRASAFDRSQDATALARGASEGRVGTSRRA